MLTTALFGISFGAFYSFLPLLAERRGLEPVGLAYTIYGASIILTRILTANLLDRPDRAQVLAPSLLVTTVGLAGFAFANSWPVLLISAALMAAGSGIVHPALIALCPGIRRAIPARSILKISTQTRRLQLPAQRPDFRHAGLWEQFHG